MWGLLMINDFRGQYRWLSNFHVADVVFEGDTYPSSEHAYQAAKCSRKENRIPFQSRSMTCGQSKKAGGLVATSVAEWDAKKYGVMLTILIDKFTRHDDLRKLLLGTGDEELKEGNYWHDNFYGSCSCNRCGDQGQNNLGKILMEIRTALRGEQ